MEVKNIESGAELNYLYKHSALTWEGLTTDEESLKDVAEWLESKGALIGEPSFYLVKGAFMNDYYQLTGSNCYPCDLHIVSVNPKCIDLKKVILARFEVGGRWFDDIVDNNLRREEEK